MSNIIDPHLHFFDLELGQYTWLQSSGPKSWPNYAQIHKNHHIRDLLSSEFNVEGFVHIEAGFDNHQPINELYWLQSTVKTVLFKAISYIAIDSEPEQFNALLCSLQRAQCLIGIRDICEGKEHLRLLNDNTAVNLVTLAKHDLLFEAQFELSHTETAQHLASLCKKYPGIKLIINHCGLISSSTEHVQAIKLLSQCDNVAIKFSGLELIDKPLPIYEQLQCILSYFGEDKVMFASNYPVCLINKTYTELWREYRALICDESLWVKLSYANAKRIYSIT